jgi:hypothetical protein
VTRIDRLARSTFDLFAIVKRIVDAGGQFRSLAEPLADTSTSTGRLLIAILGGSLNETHLCLLRTISPIASAGIGRPPRRTRRTVHPIKIVERTHRRNLNDQARWSVRVHDGFEAVMQSRR